MMCVPFLFLQTANAHRFHLVKKRTLSTVGLCLLVFLFVWILGAPGGIILLALMSSLAQWELYQLLEQGGRARPNKPLGIALGVLVIFAVYWAGGDSGIETLGLAMVVLLVTVLVSPRIGEVFLPTLFGFVYLPLMLLFYGLLMVKYGSLFVPLWVIAVAKSSDIGGLLVGSRIGKTKLMPSVSPGKTIEGAIGGIFASAIVGVVAAQLFATYNNDTIGLSFMSAALIGAVIGAVAIVSDLLESRLKRWADVKDSGNAIPGIGGALDLMDSLVLVGPIAFILFKYIA